MPRSLPAVVVLIAALTIISAVYTYLRAETITPTNQLESKTLAAARRDTAVFYLILGVVVGVIGYFVFRHMHDSSPDAAPRNFLYLALGIGVVLEIMAFAVFKTRSLLDFTVLHVLYVVVYGGILPLVVPV
jgi:hypothetical protein